MLKLDRLDRLKLEPAGSPAAGDPVSSGNKD